MDTLTPFLSAALVLGLLGLTVWALRRGSGWRLRLPGRPRRGDALMESLERLSLSPQHTLHLVRVGNRAVLVALHSGGCAVLESRPWPEAEPGPGGLRPRGGAR